MSEVFDSAMPDQTERDAILDTLKTGMQELRADIEAAEPASDREEQLQLRRYHELGYLANQYRKLKKDTDIDEMAERLDFLEEDLDE